MNSMRTLLHHLVETSAQANPDAEALAYRGVRLNYSELHQRIETTAASLHALGLQQGDRVAVYLPKQLETVQALIAATRAGGIMVPVNPLLKSAQVAHILQDCEPSVLITSRDRIKLLADVLNKATCVKQVISVDGLSDVKLPEHMCLSDWSKLQTSDSSAPITANTDDTAAILYTSGSTGKAKGVMLSHRNLLVGAESVCAYLSTTAGDRVLAVLPLSFDYGLSQLTTAFHAGASVVLLNYLLPQDVLRAVSRERITALAGVPSLWMQLSGLDWPEEAMQSLRTLTNSGGHLPTTVIDGLRERLPEAQLFLMYGLTEAFRSSYLPPAELARRPTSMGKAIPNALLAVVRPDDSLCDPNEPGELVHAGPLVAQGYWNNPEKTARHFRSLPASLTVGKKNVRAVWSGDTVTQDEDGYLYFMGREDDMIKTSGYRVSPNEVEEAVYATGLAQEAAAFGVPHPLLGQAIIVVFVPAADVGADSNVSALSEKILQACKIALPGYMVPQHIEQHTQLPKTANGKIDRPQLITAFQEHFANTP